MKNWTINEAVKVLKENNDLDAVKEIVSHFPVFAMAAAKNDLAGVAVLMGEKFTLNRLAKEPIGDEQVEDENGEAPVKAAAKTAATPDKALEDMTTKELMKLCDARGIKVPHYGKNKEFYLEQLNNAAGNAVEPEADEDGEADPYEGKTAKELHAMCKERGIKADIKKPAKFYADLLRKADAAADDEDDTESDGDDGWGEEEATEEKPAKAEKKPAAKAAPAAKAKPAAKAAPADDDGWDI